MRLFDKLFGRAEAGVVVAPDLAEARVHIAAPEREYVNIEMLDASALRMNMWVIYGDQLAIVTGCDAAGMVRIALQKDDGTALVELDEKDRAVNAVRSVEPASLRHARIEEIPAWRHEGEDHLRSFGYISASEVVQ